MGSDLAEGVHAILRLFVEPLAGELKMSPSAGQPTCGLYLLDSGLPIEIELEARAVLEGYLNACLGRTTEAADGRVVLGDVDWDLLANLDVNWASKPCDVGSGVLVEPRNVWADSGNVLLHGGAILHGYVVDFGVSQHRLWEMELPVVILLAPIVVSDFGFVNDLRLGSTELDVDWSLLWTCASEACPVESNLGVSPERTRERSNPLDSERIDERERERWVSSNVVLPVDRDFHDSVLNLTPLWRSATDLVGKCVRFVAANRRGLHDSSLVPLHATVAGEPAGEVPVLFNPPELVAFAPEEVGVDQDRLVLVGVGESAGEAVEDRIAVVPEVDIVFGEISSRIHHVDGESVVADVDSARLEHVVLDKSVDLGNVLVLDAVGPCAGASGALKPLAAVHEVHQGFIVLHLHETVAVEPQFGTTSRAHEPWADIEDIGVNVAESHPVVRVVLVVHRNVDVKRLWGGILGNGALYRPCSCLVAIHVDLITELVREPDSDFAAVLLLRIELASRALEVLSHDGEVVVVRVLGDAIGGLNLSDPWPVEVGEVVAGVLPVLPVW